MYFDSSFDICASRHHALGLCFIYISVYVRNQACNIHEEHVLNNKCWRTADRTADLYLMQLVLYKNAP